MRKRLILASSSPRRKALLTYITDAFEICKPDVDENINEPDPLKLVSKLAVLKAQAAAAVNSDAVIIGADTIVVQDGEIMGKPVDEADAARMLRKLAGRCHQVFTGFCVLDAESGREVSDIVETIVTFNPMTDEEIEAYIQTREPMDKAGAYGIQGFGSKFVPYISGNYFCVMGFPVSQIYDALKALGTL